VNGYEWQGALEPTSPVSALIINDSQDTGNSNIHIIGGNFKAKSSGVAGGVFVAFRRVDNCSIIGSQFHDTDASTRVQFSRCTDIRVSAVLCDYEETWFTGTYSFEDGIRIGSGCSDVVIDNCVIHSGDDAIAINNEPSEAEKTTTGADIKRVNISNCTLTTQAGHGIRIYNEATMIAGDIYDINISNITGDIAHTADAVTLQDYGSGTISRVTFDNVYIDASDVAGASNGGFNCENIIDLTLSNCTIQGYDNYGFALSGCTRAKIINPHVFSGQGGGVDGIILSNSDKSQVIGGSIRDTIRDGVHISSSDDCLIHGVTIDTPGRDGVRLSSSSLRTRIIGNSVLAAVGSGIQEESGCNSTQCFDNELSQCGTPVTLTTVGAASRYERNSGHNPRGTAVISVGASPYTYTSGPQSENVFIRGGTVSNISIGGTQVFAATGVTVNLAPNTAVVVTYSSIPTMVAYLD